MKNVTSGEGGGGLLGGGRQNNNNNIIYLKSNIKKSSIDYKNNGRAPSLCH